MSFIYSWQKEGPNSIQHYEGVYLDTNVCSGTAQFEAMVTDAKTWKTVQCGGVTSLPIRKERLQLITFDYDHGFYECHTSPLEVGRTQGHIQLCICYHDVSL